MKEELGKGIAYLIYVTVNKRLRRGKYYKLAYGLRDSALRVEG
jgi:hypothetical protein